MSTSTPTTPAPVADPVVAPAPVAETPVETPAPAETPLQKVEDTVNAEVEKVAPEAEPFAEKAEADVTAAVENAAKQGAVLGASNALAHDPALEEAWTDMKTAYADVRAGDLKDAVGEFDSVAGVVKAGFKTTEFWMTIVLIVLTQVGALNIPGKYGDTITTFGAAAAYILSRGIAKTSIS